MFYNAFKLFLLFSMVVTFYPVFGQKSITLQSGYVKGILVDSISRKPIAFATLILRNRNNYKTGVVSDDKGSFLFKNIKPEIYTLQATFVGYHPKIISKLIISSDSSIDLDTITLAVDNKVLHRVNVIAHTNLIEDKGDRIVYNAESDISNQGGNAIDVLRKTPVVSVDASGNVEMLGSGSIRILVNGKPLSISTRSIGDALKTIPSSTIKSIEIITSPSARYDSEGTGGILNIITRKDHIGTDGNVTLTGGNLTQNMSASYSFHTDKLGINFEGAYGRNINEGNSSFERINDTENAPFSSLFQRNEFNNKNRSWEGDIGITYDVDSLNMLSFSVANWGRRDPNLTSLYSVHNYADQPVHEYRQDIDFKNPFGNLSTNLAYTHHFRNRKQELEIISQYSNTYDDYAYTIDRFDPLNSLFYRELSENNSNSKEWTVQADYTHPFDMAQRHILEMGAKVITRNMHSDYEVDDSASGSVERPIINTSRSNIFDYTQRVMAGYTSLKVNVRSGWLFLMGVRLEHTDMEGAFQNQLSSFRNDYFNLLPSLSVSKKIGDRQVVKASFTQRLLRPQVWNLNPFIIPADPNNLIMGNPELKPELSHIMQVGLSTTTLSGVSLNSNFYWRQSDNAMQNIITVQTDGKALIYPENAGRHRRIGISINASTDINKTWSFSTNVEGYNAYLRSELVDFSNKGWFFKSSVNTSFKLPEKLSLQLFGNYSSGTIWLQRKSKETYYYSASVRKDFLNDRAFVTLNIENPFNEYNVQELIEHANGFDTFRVNNYMNRSVRLSLNWKFGNSSSRKERVAKKVINDDNSGR